MIRAGETIARRKAAEGGQADGRKVRTLSRRNARSFGRDKQVRVTPCQGNLRDANRDANAERQRLPIL